MNKIPFFTLFVFLFPVLASAQSAGSLDSTFNNTGIVLDQYNNKETCFDKLLLQPDGKSITIGFINYNNSVYDEQTIVKRFNVDGTPDLSFGVNGAFASSPDEYPSDGHDGHLYPDGSLLVISTGFGPNLIIFYKLLPNGTLDSTFGVNGKVIKDIISNENLEKGFVLPNGKIVVIGHYRNSMMVLKGFVARFNEDGEVDTDFGVNGVAILNEPSANGEMTIVSGAVQPDGKILICGSIGDFVQDANWLIIRLNANGTYDPEFGTNGIVMKSIGSSASESCETILMQPDGKFLGAGFGQKFPGFHFTILRFNSDGTQDMTFGLSGKAQIGMNCCESIISSIAQQADGKIVACGYSSDDYEHYKFAVARFKPNGAIDQTFGNAGRLIMDFEPDTAQLATALVIQNDHKILIAGYTSEVGWDSGTGILVRLNPGAVVVDTQNPVNPAATDIQISPNPLQGSLLHLSYALESASAISLSVYDLTGRWVTTLLREQLRLSGDNTESLQLPEDLPQGTYFLELISASGTSTLKLIKIN